MISPSARSPIVLLSPSFYPATEEPETFAPKKVGSDTIQENRMSVPQPKLGISSYSFWHFRGPKVPIETVIERACALEVPGVEILHRQMESEEPYYCQRLKRYAF